MDDSGLCDGGGDVHGDHCCSIEGEDCPHLVVDGPSGRRFACGLFTELGDWDLVHADPRYLADVRPGLSSGTVDCGVWFGAPDSEMSKLTEVYHKRAQCCFQRLWADGGAKEETAVSILVERER